MTTSKVRWQEVMQKRHDHLKVVNAINALDHRWHTRHSEMDGSEFTVEGLYLPHFEVGIRGVPVPIDSLGSTCLTQIAGSMAMVSLPLMSTALSGQSISLQQPYFHHPWLRDVDWSGSVDVRWGWGTASTAAKEGFFQAFRVAVAPDEGMTSDEAGILVRQALPDWWRRVIEWLELLSDRHVRSVDNFHWSEGSSALYTSSSDDRLKHVPGQSWMRSSTRVTSAWKTLNCWSSAVQLAGIDAQSPLACTLIVNAIRAFREGEYRTCVADAGTAAEIALRDALRTIRRPPGDKATLGSLQQKGRDSIHGLVPAVFKRRHGRGAEPCHA